jgi:CBS domain containing-hemolysin-like protein
MSTRSRALEKQLLDNETTYLKPVYSLRDNVSLSDPAIEVMTDLTKTSAQTVNPCALLKEATERMIASNVRLLFVVNQHHHIMGIITSKDVEGERVMNHLSKVGGNRDEIMVRDLMTPQFKVEVLSMEDVRVASVGDIIETLKRMGRQHALVSETDENGRQVIRGILSTTSIARQTGVEINTSDVAGGNIANLQSSRG